MAMVVANMPTTSSVVSAFISYLPLLDCLKLERVLRPFFSPQCAMQLRSMLRLEGVNGNQLKAEGLILETAKSSCRQDHFSCQLPLEPLFGHFSHI
jgi:hypothetical protein